MRAVLRPRVALVAVLALLAAAGLTACRTNVGYAATVDGRRYSESDIGDYLTPAAQPVKRQTSGGGQEDYPVRAFVVETIIGVSLLDKVASRLPSGAPSSAQLARLRAEVLQGGSARKTVESAGIRGFSASFDELLVRRVAIAQFLQTAAQQSVPVQQVLSSTPFPVSVNPRYGVWNAKTRSFDGATGAGAPSFLKLESSLSTTAATDSGAGTGTSP